MEGDERERTLSEQMGALVGWSLRQRKLWQQYSLTESGERRQKSLGEATETIVNKNRARQ